LVEAAVTVKQGWVGYALQDFLDAPAVVTLRKTVHAVNKTMHKVGESISAFVHGKPFYWNVALPIGWDSASDPSTGRTYYWNVSDPLGTRTWTRPTVAPVAKFRDMHQDSKPEDALGVRHAALLPNWLPNVLWLALPSLIGMAIVYRKCVRPSRHGSRTSRFNTDDVVAPLSSDLQAEQQCEEALLVVE
jgi:hypothetical protein